jgi:DNA-binding NarL/FixJ family response regulator
MAIQVLLLDDHPLIVSGLAQFLAPDPDFEVVGKVHTPAEAFRLLKTTPVDVVVSDMHFEDNPLTGTAFMLQARTLYPHLKVVFYTMLEKGADVREAILAGARGYVLKRYDADDVGRAIRTVCLGKPYYSPEIVLVLAQLPPPPTQTDEEPNPLRTLSPREKEVMILLARGLTISQIAQQLPISESTVHTHRTNLMSKLSVTSNVGIAHFAFKYGLLE